MAHSGSFSAPAPNGGSLFFGPNGADNLGQPVQVPQHSAEAAGAVLTVADVLPQLPPEMAKASAVRPDQAVQISAALLHQALSTGLLAVPLFEVYRVCPAIFQSPVSPDDPRQVRLPPAKLPALIAASQGIQGGASGSPSQGSSRNGVFGVAREREFGDFEGWTRPDFSNSCWG